MKSKPRDVRCEQHELAFYLLTLGFPHYPLPIDMKIAATSPRFQAAGLRPFDPVPP